MLFYLPICAQTDDDSSRIVTSSFILKVTNEKQGVIRYFSENEEVIYIIKDTPTLKTTGTITYIKKDSLVIDNKAVALTSLTYLSNKSQKREARAISLLLAVAGGISVTSGGILVVVGNVFTKIIGGTAIIIGMPTLISGIKKYFATNYLILEKGWSIETMRLGGIPD